DRRTARGRVARRRVRRAGRRAERPSGAVVAWHFARLKLRLIRNGLRSPQYALMFILGASAAGVLALGGFVALATLRNQSIGPDVTLTVFAAVTVMWIVVPLIGFGTDETLDPQRLA